MGGEDNESFDQLVYAFFQELLGSLFMYLLFFPVGAMLGNTLEGWVFHFLAVICFDIITAGSCANPAVCIALYFAGKLTMVGTLVRIIAELLVGIVGFTFLHAVVPQNLVSMTGGPELTAGVDVYYGAFMEGSLTLMFALTVLLASSFVTDPEMSRPLFAAVLRILIEIGGPTSGANMNSMVGFSWAWYTGRLYSIEYQTVYFVAPLIGGLLAASVYNSTMNFLPVKQEKSTEVIVNIVETTKPPTTKKSAKKGVKGKSSVSSDKKSAKASASIDNSRPKTRSEAANPQLRKRSKK